MQFIYSSDGEVGVGALATSLSALLNAHKRVLWLICGGSNIALAKEVMDIVQKEAQGTIGGLTIGQTDERYGPVGHPDSNWRQMLDAHFNFEGVGALPILQNKSLEDTAAAYSVVLADAFGSHDAVVAQFGIGADGHVAGMLPHSPAVGETALVVGYESKPFVRITMTPPAFAHINAAYTFVFGEGKKEAVAKLQTQELSLSDEPCQILKTIPESFFYSDQIS